MRVLLVRPHDFIVAQMKAFLTLAGFEPKPLTSLAELGSAGPDASGAVISTAATSVIPESFRETFERVRKVTPHLPAVAATLSQDISRAMGLVEAELSGVRDHRLLPPLKESLTSPHLGTPGTLLLLRRDDLEATDPLPQQLIQRHFGRR